MGTNPNPFAAGLVKVATTPLAGFALQNATPSILTWTAPNDGNLHTTFLSIYINTTSQMTGGAVHITFTDPTNSSRDFGLFNGGYGAGQHGWGNNDGSWWSVPVYPGTTYTLKQNSALTGGAATVWAEIWAS